LPDSSTRRIIIFIGWFCGYWFICTNNINNCRGGLCSTRSWLFHEYDLVI